MTEFLAALAIFLASHSIPARPRTRAALVGILGERFYIAIYALISLALLGWLIVAARHAPYIPLWAPEPSLYWAPILVMPVALFFLIGGTIIPNPLSVGFMANRFDPNKPGLVGITRHPILWGFVFWSACHVIPNGDLVSAILFGGFAAFALLAMPIIDRRKQRQLGLGWPDLARRTSVIPFWAMLRGPGSRAWPGHSFAMTAVITIIAYAALLLAHATLFGPDPTIILF